MNDASRPRKASAKSYTLGRAGFAKISAIEGIHLTPEMEAQFLDFDRQGLSPDDRRKAIAHAFSVPR